MPTCAATSPGSSPLVSSLAPTTSLSTRSRPQLGMTPVDRLSLFLVDTLITFPRHEGALWHSKTNPRISFTRYRDTSIVEIEVEKNFKIKAMAVPITGKDSLIHNHGITDEDCFSRLDLSFKFYALSGDVSGVLGQTYARNHMSWAKMGVAMPVLGGEREFASSGLFTTDYVASWFISQLALWNSVESFEYANLECRVRWRSRGPWSCPQERMLKITPQSLGNPPLMVAVSPGANRGLR
ncbi:hypothetical protein NL676_004727 [Syzygium grande]|nr:hypothetical protein NL676_004727 [Syzygium grande]